MFNSTMLIAQSVPRRTGNRWTATNKHLRILQEGQNRWPSCYSLEMVINLLLILPITTPLPHHSLSGDTHSCPLDANLSRQPLHLIPCQVYWSNERRLVYLRLHLGTCRSVGRPLRLFGSCPPLLLWTRVCKLHKVHSPIQLMGGCSGQEISRSMDDDWHWGG